MKRFLFLLTIIILVIQVAFSQGSGSLNVASFNLRYNNPGDGINAWPNRKELVKGLIQFHDFDIFGTQEGLFGQLNDIIELPQYSFTGHGRDDGQQAGEHSAIVYKKDRFTLLASGDFWLSETPDKPGKGWDATCCNRICSWGKFSDKQTKREFYFFSVHFDHQGVEARRQSGKLMVQKIKEIAKDVPVICVGDLNSTPETEQVITIQTHLGDAYKLSAQAPYGPEGTFTSFKIDAPMKERIDYIFVSKQFSVLKYGVLTDSYHQRFPSDHFPIMAKITIN